jgi:maltose/maltodextrin transport system permease protein
MAISETTARAGVAPRVTTAPQPSAFSRYGATVLAALIGVAALYLVTVVYAVGQTLLAIVLLTLVALAVWTYTSTKTLALRYLFPGLAAAMVFVVFPMLYTITIGFTNYSSNNLLDYERARRYFLDDTFRAPGPAYAFTLLADGAQFRLRLEDQDDDKRVFVSPPLALNKVAATDVKLESAGDSKAAAAEPLTMKDVIARQAALKALLLKLPDGATVRMSSVRLFAPVQPRYKSNDDGSLTDVETKAMLKPNHDTGFFETATGEAKQPGFTVPVGFAHFKRMFTDRKFSEPFIRIFVWTVTFAGLTVVFASGLGLFLAALLNWDALRFKGVFRLLLFLPYAVPGFISILIFKGLFNQNLGEINVVLNGLFGIKPAWFADPFLAKTMLLIVNTWLGFPYMMVVCMGLIKSIPADLYEASAVAGAGPLTNFFQITMPLILKPLTPLLISSFAFNFNNFVLITLLTGGAPDYLDTSVPAGTTDILVSYTNRIAFQDSGAQFGLASAISTVIFLLVATMTLVQMRFTRMAADDKR